MNKYEQKHLNNEILTNHELYLYYTYKYPRKNIIYKGRAMPGISEKLKIDVRNFILPNDFFIKEFISTLNLRRLENDDKVLKIQEAVINCFEYRFDKQQTGFTEYWQFPFETFALWGGDCEDGAIVVASALISAGIPRYRVRVAAGAVEHNNRKGGHAYATYLRESDNKWCAIDWCFLEDSSVPVKDKKPLKERSEYKDVWFSWNDRMSWAQDSLEFQSIKNKLEKKNV